MKPILEIKGISKKFRIRHEQQPYLSLRDSITSVFNKNKITKEEFWALKNVSFNVMPGESIGIIGKNGAGKSTLLKILSKITPPTEGKIISRGRIASLLEVGTGFHPELTGRENVFLNGSILGMKRKEIQERFDGIVDFSGVEKFLDTPLKHYSSGMQLRLAFAVATFLEPEILVIDEVLAVGDASFQQKCINKILSLTQSGTTILFVSHTFSIVESICKRAIVLENGNNVYQGTPQDAISFYNSKQKLSGAEVSLTDVIRNNYGKNLIFEKISFGTDGFKFGENIKFKLKFKRRNNIPSNTAFKDIDIGIAIRDKYSNSIIHTSNRFLNVLIDHKGDDTWYCFDIENILKPDTYFVTLFLRSEDVIQDWLTDIVQFNVLDGNPYNYSNTNMIYGIVLPNYKFYLENAR